MFGPYLYRSEFWARSEAEECARALHHRAGHFARGSRNSRRHLAEDHPGTAGVLVLLVAYLAGVRAIADLYGIVLMLDEVMAGFAGPVRGWLWTPSTSSPT